MQSGVSMAKMLYRASETSRWGTMRQLGSRMRTLDTLKAQVRSASELLS